MGIRCNSGAIPVAVTGPEKTLKIFQEASILATVPIKSGREGIESKP